MKITTRKRDNVTILDLKGSFKMGRAEEAFRDSVEQLLESGASHLAVNLADVPEMDSSGIGALIRAYSAAKQAGGKCVFFAAPKRIKLTLRMGRLDQILELAEDEATALASF